MPMTYDKRSLCRKYVAGKGMCTFQKKNFIQGMEVQPVPGFGLTIPGTGVTIPGTEFKDLARQVFIKAAFAKGNQNTSLFAVDPKTKAGKGLIVPGTSIKGDGIFEDIGKTISRFVKSGGIKSSVRFLRKSLSPLVKQGMKQLLEKAPALLMNTPFAALAPVAAALKTPLTKLSNLGISKLNTLAESKGYGAPAAPYKLTKKNIGRDSSTITRDRHALKLYNNVVVSSPISGSGLLPL